MLLLACVIALPCAPEAALAEPVPQGNPIEAVDAISAAANDALVVSPESFDGDLARTISTQAKRAKRPTDIVFIVDTTGSMSSYIYKVKSNLIAFVKRMKQLGVNPRMALVEYRDVYSDGKKSTKLHRFGASGSYWTRHAKTMIRHLNSLKTGGGGDTPETPTHALDRFLKATKFKKGSDRFVFLLTDAGYKTSSYGSKSIAPMYQCVNKLKKKKAHAIVVSKSSYRSTYYSLFNDTGGRFVDISTSSYSSLLYSTATWIGELVLESYKIPNAKTNVGKCYYTGNAVKPKIVVRCNGKKLKYGRDYVIVYTNNTKVGRGTATIYARGNYVGNKSLTFKILRADIGNVRVSTNSMMYSGSACRPVPSRVYYKGHALVRGVDYEIIRYGDNVNAGKKAYYIIRGLGSFRGTKRVYFRIERAPISSAYAYVNPVTYNGKAKRPKPVISFNGKTLQRKKDYRIAGYANNVNAGTHASVTVKGAGNFKGTMKVRFTIRQAELRRTSASVRAVTYNGEKQRPDPKLSFKNMKLRKGRDFEIVGYENNRNAGKEALVVLKGTGNFKGTKRVKFTIRRAAIDEAEASVNAVIYTGRAQTPGIAAASFNGKRLKAGRDFHIASYARNVNAGKQARVTIRGTGNFRGTKNVPFTIKRAKLRKATVTMKSPTYTGEERRPKVESAVFNGKKLKAGRDYSIIGYENNVNAGRGAIATLEGRGNFQGAKKVRFIIQKASLKKASAIVASATYTGKAKTPKVTSVRFKDRKLKAGVDYRVTGYRNNVNAGKDAVAKLTGMGNFSGSKSFSFVIKRADISRARVSAPAKSYTGSAIVPAVKARCFGKKLISGTDFTLKCKNNVRVGTASAIITGKGNFKGKQTVKFKVVRASIAGAAVAVEKQTYTGKALKPKPTSVVVNGRTLKAGKDYKVVGYANNVAPGEDTATLTIRGVGGYKGKQSVRFSIENASAVSYSSSLEAASPAGF